MKPTLTVFEHQRTYFINTSTSKKAP